MTATNSAAEFKPLRVHALASVEARSLLQMSCITHVSAQWVPCRAPLNDAGESEAFQSEEAPAYVHLQNSWRSVCNWEYKPLLRNALQPCEASGNLLRSLERH